MTFSRRASAVSAKYFWYAPVPAIVPSFVVDARATASRPPKISSVLAPSSVTSTT